MSLFLLIISINTFANERLVKNVFFAAEKEVRSLLDFTPRYNLIVSSETLIDNRGSLVDALGVPGKIILNEESWLDFYRKGIDVRLLVLHELLRSQGIDDDNYVQSLPLMDEVYRQEAQESLRRRDSTPYCALNVSKFTFREKTKKIKVTGDSQPMTGGVFTFPNPFAQEATENALINAREKCLEKGYESFRYESGHVEMRNSQRNFKSESVTRATVRGRCVKNKPQKRHQRDIARESCDKALSCLSILETYPERSQKEAVLNEVNRQKEKYCDR